MKQILITGGAGFIGSNFIRYILNKYPDYKIVNLDKLTYAGNLDNLKDIEKNPRYSFVKGDICNPKVVDKALRGCDYLINFAAESHVDRSIQNAAHFINTNINGTHVLLEAARRKKIERFIQISTDEVYGSIKKGLFTEESSLKPNSPYAASKAAADLLAHSYFVTYNLPVVITRSSNNFGPYQFPEKIIPLFITNALQDKKLPLYGDGLNVRDWLFVIDNCSALDVILHKGKIGEVYNIGGGSRKTNRELTEIILKILNKPKSLIEYVCDRPGHDRRYALGCTKVKKLGYKGAYPFKKALTDTVSWYKDNINWWKKLKRKAARLI